MTDSIHISLSAEPIAYLGQLPITNSMLLSLIVSVCIISFAIAVNRTLKQTDKPGGMQNFAEWMVESFSSLAFNITGDIKKSHQFLPFISAFFIFILLNNWAGLIPGVGTIFVHKPVEPVITSQLAVVPTVFASQLLAEPVAEGAAPAIGETSETAPAGENVSTTTRQPLLMVPLFRAGTADLNTTIALSMITIVLVQFWGVAYLKLGYLKKYINFASPIMFFVGLLEIISELAKIISFAFRLFGNIFAGEVLLAVILYLTKVLIPLPFYGLEIFVGGMQALVFSMLSLVFYNMATMGHDEH